MPNLNDLVPFEEHKTAKELGIDTTRKFVVVDWGSHFNKGDVLVLDKDDFSLAPLFRRLWDGRQYYCSWSSLAYAPDEMLREEKQEETSNIQMYRITIDQLFDDGDTVYEQIIDLTPEDVKRIIKTVNNIE